MIAVEFCPTTTDVKGGSSHFGCVFPPSDLDIGGSIASDFICLKCVGVLSSFSHSASSAWRTVRAFEVLWAPMPPSYGFDMFCAAYVIRKTGTGVLFFKPQSLAKIDCQLGGQWPWVERLHGPSFWSLGSGLEKWSWACSTVVEYESDLSSFGPNLKGHGSSTKVVQDHVWPPQLDLVAETNL